MSAAELKTHLGNSAVVTSPDKEGAKTGWLEIRKMCPNGETGPADCCFRDLAL
jgi:hypothetical protein